MSRSQATKNLELKVGTFVALGLGFSMLAIIMLGGENFVKSYSYYNVHFANVEGLINGAKVILNGIRVGAVHNVSFDESRKDIRVTLEIDRQYKNLIRQNTLASIDTQGMLGDKFLSLSGGSELSPAIEDGGEIQLGESQNLSQFIDSGEQLMGSLNSIALSLRKLLGELEKENRYSRLVTNLTTTSENLSAASSSLKTEMKDLKVKETMNHLQAILAKIDGGQGTMGALINDPALYDDLKALLGGSNRNRIMRNLIRRTIQEGEDSTTE